MYLASSGKMRFKDIALELENSDSQTRNWNNQDHWVDELYGNATRYDVSILLLKLYIRFPSFWHK